VEFKSWEGKMNLKAIVEFESREGTLNSKAGKESWIQKLEWKAAFKKLGRKDEFKSWERKLNLKAGKES
jgi:hypothetical protein